MKIHKTHINTTTFLRILLILIVCIVFYLVFIFNSNIFNSNIFNSNILEHNTGYVDKSNIWVMAFGGGGQNYYDAVNRLGNEFKTSGYINDAQFIKYTDDDLKKDDMFWNKHKKFIEQNKRLYGYCIWRPYLILKTLLTLKDGDILIYIDGGCEIEQNGETEFNNLIEQCNHSMILYTYATSGVGGVYGSGENHYIEKDWSKMDLIQHLNVNRPDILNVAQYQDTVIFFKKTKQVIEFVQDWNYILNTDYHLVDDTPSIIPNAPSFIEHRHEQSVFSLLIKSDKYSKLFNNKDNAIQSSFPIKMSRKRHG